MAKKAAKTLAARNTQRLNITLVASLVIHGSFWLLRLLVFRKSFTRATLVRYVVLSAPSLIIQFWFERIARPSYGPSGEVRRSGEDLEAKGLTEWMWDVLYWTYGCIFLVSLLGDWAWWLWAIIPLYSAYLAYTTFTGARQSMAGLAGSGGGDDGASASQGSKRQQKMEKRGGQKVQYR
ncbi:hypothetical protein NA57DRAFT_62647 [Rhizodiscina lignyota]|uniref:DUF788-domain-containing protein n=1 Tax=Rhizodiscina lignyota TaxID=1504668 RepID=A0A9P4IT52_9PEZI|nr:hypothetical protein NA57DRAFT_62647 [Rhizodiscina lignyota]